MKTLIVIKTSYGDEYTSVIETETIEELEQFIDDFTEHLSSVSHLNFKTNDDCFVIIPKNILDKSLIEFKMVKDWI